MMSDEVLATVQAAPARRWMAVGMLLVLGAMLIYVALTTPSDLHWRAFLLITGGAALWMGDRLRRATEHALELTETELRSTDGTVLARIDQIETVERGAFAFKPSNGFLITLHASGPRVWHPGLWWRIGRRVGVGGVVAAAQTKFMSEILSAQVAERAQLSDHTT